MITVDSLEPILLDGIARADLALVSDASYLRCFGLPPATITAGDLWRHLRDDLRDVHPPAADEFAAAWSLILDRGPLARRILDALGPEPDRPVIEATYARLANCLAEGRLFE
jgi:hypothetical protein